jgi:hypothetical protein
MHPVLRALALGDLHEREWGITGEPVVLLGLDLNGARAPTQSPRTARPFAGRRNRGRRWPTAGPRDCPSGSRRTRCPRDPQARILGVGTGTRPTSALGRETGSKNGRGDVSLPSS